MRFLCKAIPSPVESAQSGHTIHVTQRDARDTDDQRGLRSSLRPAAHAGCRAGRGQERLPGRDDHPARPPGGAGAAGLCDDRGSVPGFPGAERVDAPHRGASQDPRRRRREGVGGRRRADPRVDRPGAAARAPRGRDRKRLRAAVPGPGWRSVLRGALVRHRGGPARRVVRRAAGDLPQHPRHRQPAVRGQARVRLPVQRSRHLLPRAPGLHATPTWPCRRACSAWCEATWAQAA